jgi:hypothetical protein
MPFCRIGDQLGFDAKALERAIESFGLAGGIVHIVFANEDQGWGLGDTDVSRWLVTSIDLGVIPGCAEPPVVAVTFGLELPCGPAMNQKLPASEQMGNQRDNR